MTATYMYGGCASLKEYTMHYQDQSTLALLTACLIQQNAMLKSMDATLHELMEHVGSVGDRLWRMERRATAQPVDQAGTRKRAAKARRKAVARKRSGK